MSIRLGNAPCSWGTIEGFDAAPITYGTMLDELVEAGYVGTELGDYGYMPTDPEQLRDELLSRELVMLGAYEGVQLRDPGAPDAAWPRLERIARLLAAVADLDARPPLLVLADKNGSDPVRTLHAGRVTPAMRLGPAERAVFARGVERIARRLADETGIGMVFHHHCAAFVETPEEIDDLLERTDPSLVSLVFDTGHFSYGSGPPAPASGGTAAATASNAQGADPNKNDVALEGLRRLWPRVRYVHFKDCDEVVAARARRNGWGYADAVRNGIFCELGKGVVDFAGIVAFLRDQGYDDWITVEQDVLPGMGTPLASARRNRDYLAELGL